MFLLIKLFPEIIIKSRRLRWKQTARLRDNILSVLRSDSDEGVDSPLRAQFFWDHITVHDQRERLVSHGQRLRDVPGIHSIQMVEEHPFPRRGAVQWIAEKIARSYAAQVAGCRFAVRIKRSGSHDFTSPQLERHTGAALLGMAPSATVDLMHPEVVVNAEVRDQKLRVIVQKWAGLGGFPLGTQPPVLALLSGGFDSPVASYMCMKRGCKVDFLFFNLGGNAHKIGAQQVALYLWQRFASSHRSTFYSVPLEPVTALLFHHGNPSINGILLKRAMVKIASQLAVRIQTPALVTGESIAQVSSQTLGNLATINAASDKMILRPLITMNKSEIIAVAEKIGTAVFARNMPEYCAAFSHKPEIAVSTKTARMVEEKMGTAVLQEALEATEALRVSKVITAINDAPAVSVVGDPDGVRIIDIRPRTDSKVASSHHIPFHLLNKQFPQLSMQHRYALFCDHGVMSQLHASYLRDKGFDNVCVYRPANAVSV